MTDAPEPPAARRILPTERQSITHKFQVGAMTGYLTVGLYPDDHMPAEIFLTMGKEGGVVSGLLDAFATAFSFGLQYGVPLQHLVGHFTGMSFEPRGHTGNPDIPYAQSIPDYVARWLALRFLPAADEGPAPEAR